jgi:alpha-ketoglutarate-dependent taurine dioxygenase
LGPTVGIVLKTERLTPGVGAEIVGLDREQLLSDPDLPGEFMDALEEHGVLVCRGLHMDDDTQVEFCRRLGRVESLPGRPIPEITTIALDPERSPIADYLQGTFDWHIDGTTDDVPNKATVLSAHAVAPTGGETEFASTYGAYESLAEAEKQRFAQVRVVHSLAASQRRYVPDPTPQQREAWNRRPSREHPLVWEHRSGRRSLVLGATTDHVVGVPEEDGRALLDGLLEHSTGPDRMYRHEWQVGDMVVWDNCGVLHRACPYETGSPREMHRTIILGDEPIS